MDGQAKVNLILELKNRLKTGLSKAKESLNSNVRDMKGKLAELKTSHIEAFKAMKDEVPGFGRAMEMIGNPYVLVTAGLIALGAAGFKAASWSNDWKKNMAEVNVTAGLAPKELDKLSDKLVDIGTRNVAPLEEVPQAFNRILSAGLDVNTSLKVLEPTLRAAKAGFTDMETVAAAGVGVMNSSGENINRVYDILFATLNKGNAKFQDIAHYLPKIVPLAKGAGFALAETAGAWAFLTAQGQNAEQATTGITNMVKAFSTGSTVKGLKSVGVNIYTDKGKIKPIVEIIDLLSAKMNGLSDRGKTKFLEKAGITDMESKGAILSMVQNVQKLKDTTDFVTKSQGALNQAYDAAKTPMDNWMIMMNIMKGRVVKPLGDVLLGAFSKLGFWLLDKGQKVVTWFKDLYNNSVIFRDIISGIGTVIEWAFKILTIGYRASWNIIKGIGEGISKLFNSDMGKGIESFYLKIRPYFIWLKDIVGEVTNILYKFITYDFKGAWKGVKDFKMPSLDKIRKEQTTDIVNRKNSGVYQKVYDQKLAEARKRYGLDEDGNPFAAKGKAKKDTDEKSLNDKSVEKITGSAKQIRNIHINIDSFVKGGINTQHTNMQQMDEKQIEAFLKDMFMRVIANVETAYQ